MTPQELISEFERQRTQFRGLLQKAQQEGEESPGGATTTRNDVRDFAESLLRDTDEGMSLQRIQSNLVAAKEFQKHATGCGVSCNPDVEAYILPPAQSRRPFAILAEAVLNSPSLLC